MCHVQAQSLEILQDRHTPQQPGFSLSAWKDGLTWKPRLLGGGSDLRNKAQQQRESRAVARAPLSLSPQKSHRCLSTKENRANIAGVHSSALNSA